MTDDFIEARVRAAVSQVPGPGLRERVLNGAAVFVRPDVTWSDRIWFSRGWRAAAGALALTVVLAQAFTAATRPPSPGPDPAVVEATRMLEQVSLRAGIGPAEAAAIARAVLEPPPQVVVDRPPGRQE